MSKFSYILVTLSLKENLEEVLTAYVQGSIEQSLTTIFGEIGGCVELEILNHAVREFVLKVPERDVRKVRAALSFISHFQGVPCYFKVTKVSAIPLGGIV